MSKEIRILTGLHAGARMPLTPGDHIIGKGRKSTIRISDWDTRSVHFHVSDDGEITSSGSEDESEEIPVFRELEPVRYGEIVLVVGDSKADWPSDLALLERTLSPQPAVDPQGATQRATQRNSTGKAKWMVALGGIVLLGVSLTYAQQAAEPLQVTTTKPINALPRLASALAALHQPELSLSTNQENFTVRGLVTTSSELHNVIESLNRIAPGKIQPDITVIGDVIENLQTSVGDHNVKVTYRGQGIFSVSGRTRKAEQVKRILEKIKTDLGTNVARLEISVQPFGEELPPNTDAAVQTDSVRYAETTDGVKHFLSPATL